MVTYLKKRYGFYRMYRRFLSSKVKIFDTLLFCYKKINKESISLILLGHPIQYLSLKLCLKITRAMFDLSQEVIFIMFLSRTLVLK